MEQLEKKYYGLNSASLLNKLAFSMQVFSLLQQSAQDLPDVKRPTRAKGEGGRMWGGGNCKSLYSKQKLLQQTHRIQHSIILFKSVTLV